MWYRIEGKNVIEVERIGRVRYTKNWNTDGRECKIDRLLMILSGKIRYVIDDKEYNVQGGDYLFIPKGAFFSSSITEPCEFSYLHFVNTEVTPIDDRQYAAARAALCDANARDVFPFGQFADNHDTGIYIKDTADLSEHFDDILKFVNNCESSCYLRRPDYKLTVNLRFMRLLAHLSQYCDPDSGVEADVPPVLLRLTSYVQKHYTDDITLTSISQGFSLSKQYIIRLFRTYLGTTVTKYVNELRLERSLELLRHTNMNVSEIAEFVGFHSVYYFSRVFRATYHITPSEYALGKGDIPCL